MKGSLNRLNWVIKTSALGFFLLLTLAAPPAGAAIPGPSALTASAPGEIIHTVQKNESLWQIAHYFGADYNELSRRNRIDNPDLIFPGEKLLIHIQADHSIHVFSGGPLREEEPPAEMQPVVAHITYPDKNEVFSPENPIAEYRVEKTLAPLRRQAPQGQTLGVFRTFLEFVEWLAVELGAPRQTQATRTASLDPGSTLSYEVSRTPATLMRPGKGQRVFEVEVFYQPPLADRAPPPPKSR